MSRATAIVSISLPPAMARELERVRKSEHRTRSELVREALRSYIRAADLRALDARIAGLREEEPDADERAAIAAGTEEFRIGKHRPLEDLSHGVPRPSQRPRRAKS